MDKNFVSIDNLVRQKLGGVEEKEREGAWMQMRELLDKEMPQNKPVGFDWRRSLIYSGVVLLVASLGIGAYDLSNHSNLLAVGSKSANTGLNSIGSNPAQSNTSVSEKGSNTNEQPIKDNNSSTSKLASNTIKSATGGASNTPKISNKAANNNTELTAKQAIGQKTNIVSNSNNTKNALTSTSDKVSRTNQPLSVGNKDNKTALADNNNNENSQNSNVSKSVNNKNNTGDLTSVKKEGSKHMITSSSVAGSKLADKNTSKNKHHDNLSNNEKTDGSTNDVAKNNNKPKDDQITINKVVLNKRFVRDETNGGYYTFDTISKEKLFEQLHSITAIADETLETKGGPLDNALASNSSSAGASNSGNAKELLSSEAPSLKASQENKTGILAKKSAGAKMLDNLSTAFNDVKYTAGNMQFTKGLTIGANSTFFAPTSFYGFHFGVTGSFNFGDAVSIVTELKYFQKINSNYQMNDDYYTYESSPGGYKKSKIDYDFSFSTLHSLELPVSIKYNISNFSFFAGGNFLYMFGINTGAAPLPDPNAASQTVTTKGNDDHPTLNYKDFGQRFGIGYLFGISFKIAPNAAIDLRSVQTVWDNMKTDGAKTVSNTLYHSPSLQLSLNYSFGSKKGESK